MARKKTDNFDPMAVRGGQMAAAGDDTDVTITFPGHEPIHTTVGAVSDDGDEAAARVNGVAGAELLQIIESIERLMEEKSAVDGDIKEKFGESKSRGFNNKAIRTIIKIRKMDANERIEEQTILDTYLAALGME